MSTDVLLEDFSDEHLIPLFELFRSYFGPDDRLLTEGYTKWLYAENPFGRARMVWVQNEGRWVGFMAMVPVELAREGERQRAYYVVNVLVHPEFHGKHLFGRMISAAKAAVAAEGAALMGHPNDMALKSWQRARMHFHEPLRPSLAWTMPLGAGVRARAVQSAQQLLPAIPVLNEVVAQSPVWRVAAAPDYLEWRYLRHPSNAYCLQLLEADGTAAGVQITKRVRPGIHLLVDQFVQAKHVKGATRRLPAFTLCFWPDSLTRERSGAAVPLPWKKRIPVFMTRTREPDPSAAMAGLGLSASDF
jgi:GNAT superfamily N-acetyltransferase